MRLKRPLFAIVAFCVFASSLSSAAIIEGPLFRIEALTTEAFGEFEVPLDAGSGDGITTSWVLEEPVVLIEDEENPTVLLSATAQYVADPVVTLNFVVSTGSATNFTINSALLSFPSIPNAIGRATAAVTVTDFVGNGASLTGLETGGKAYQAFYNNIDPPPTPGSGPSFARLVSGVSSSTGFVSLTGSENYPLTPGFSSTDQSSNTLGTVSNMSSRYMFRVSSGDSASGTSSFVIIPEPAGMLLLLVGGLALSLVRRRTR